VGPIVAATVIVCWPRAGPTPAILITQVVPIVEAEPANKELVTNAPVTVGEPDDANMPAGQLMVTAPLGTAVARVKATVTAALAPGTLLPPVSVAPVT